MIELPSWDEIAAKKGTGWSSWDRLSAIEVLLYVHDGLAFRERFQAALNEAYERGRQSGIAEISALKEENARLKAENEVLSGRIARMLNAVTIRHFRELNNEN